MRIDSSLVALSSSHTYREEYTRQESLRVWVGDPGSGEGSLTASGDLVQLSDQARALAAAEADGNNGGKAVNGAGGGKDGTMVLEASPEDKLKLLILQRLIEALTGRKVTINTLDGVEIELSVTARVHLEIARPEEQQPQQQGWGLQYDASETYIEQEKTSFAAAGIIRTSDGREIEFLLQLELSREFMQTESVSLRAGDAARIDPLVINFDGNAAELTDAKFSFDLDGDGDPDQVSFVGPGSGFLVLDRNGDGLINNGGELFGPASGNGFAELSQLDSDGNGWIDENDPAFSKLQIWTKDARGNDSLSTLAGRGVGAIYLGSVDTPFAIKDRGNVLQGEARQTGVYLSEDGKAGTIQQIDLAL
jgi:hypothetical protein